MNIRLVSKLLSILLLIISFFMLIPMGLAFYYNEYDIVPCFLWPIGIVSLLSGALLIFTRKGGKEILSPRDGFFFVTASWIGASLLGAFPAFLSGAVPSYTDAFFETMSGFTTTGASILTHIENLPRSILFWRSLTHWLGGMGIIVLTVAVLPLLGIGGLQLIRAEAPGPSVDRLTPRIAGTAKILWLIYLGFTVAETLLLKLGGMDLYDALTHTFGTLATGGFSPKNSSVGHYKSAYIDGVVTFFMICAGTNFALYYKLLNGRFRDFFKDIEFRTYICIFIGAAAVISFSLYREFYHSVGVSIRYAAFQAASILTTTGFATANFDAWPALAKNVLFVLMFIGGCSGSTGGGIKVIRIFTLIKLGINEMKYLIHPRGIFILKIGGKAVTKDIVYSIAGFYFIYISSLLIVLFVVATSGQDILTSISTALVTVGNIGPGFSKIGPTLNYAFYPHYVKWVLSMAMLIGRLELYTVLVIFTYQFWKK
ncbi:TrkH family potassium uptake protein [Spirochaetota bacterium]